MTGKMQQYIKEQPDVWEAIISERKESFALLGWEADDREIEHVVLVGSGSSYIAAQIAAEFAVTINASGCSVYTPAELGSHLSRHDRDRTLVIVVSQSGKSVSTINATLTCQKNGYQVLGFTADSSAPIAGMADWHVVIPCGREAIGPKTKGMTATILMLELFILDIAVRQGRVDDAARDRILTSFAKGIAAARVNLQLCEQYTRVHCAAFHGHEHAIVVADSGSYLTAKEGALKLLETWYVPVYTYEVEEYTHGIQNTIKEGICNIFVVSESRDAPVVERLTAYCETKGCDNWVISTVRGIRTEGNLLELEKGDAGFTTPFEILPAFQYLSAFGAEDRAINCEQPKFNDFYDFMETKRG